MQSGENLGLEFSMEYNIKHLSLADLAEYEAALKAAAKPAHGRVRTDGPAPMDVEVTFMPGGPEAVLDRMFHRDFAADGTYSNDKTPSPDEEPYALFIINPSFKLDAANSFVYFNRYKGSHCTVRACTRCSSTTACDRKAVSDADVRSQASYVAARRYVVIDIGTAPCPIRSGGSVGAEEGVVAEVTLPMLRQAVALPEGTQAATEIIGGTRHTTRCLKITLSLSLSLSLSLPARQR